MRGSSNLGATELEIALYRSETDKSGSSKNIRSKDGVFEQLFYSIYTRSEMTSPKQVFYMKLLNASKSQFLFFKLANRDFSKLEISILEDIGNEMKMYKETLDEEQIDKHFASVGFELTKERVERGKEQSKKLIEAISTSLSNLEEEPVESRKYSITFDSDDEKISLTIPYKVLSNLVVYGKISLKELPGRIDPFVSSLLLELPHLQKITETKIVSKRLMNIEEFSYALFKDSVSSTETPSEPQDQSKAHEHEEPTLKKQKFSVVKKVQKKPTKNILYQRQKRKLL